MCVRGGGGRGGWVGGGGGRMGAGQGGTFCRQAGPLCTASGSSVCAAPSNICAAPSSIGAAPSSVCAAPTKAAADGHSAVVQGSAAGVTVLVKVVSGHLPREGAARWRVEGGAGHLAAEACGQSHRGHPRGSAEAGGLAATAPCGAAPTRLHSPEVLLATNRLHRYDASSSEMSTPATVSVCV